jgi:hypothetical protein
VNVEDAWPPPLWCAETEAGTRALHEQAAALGLVITSTLGTTVLSACGTHILILKTESASTLTNEANAKAVHRAAIEAVLMTLWLASSGEPAAGGTLTASARRPHG